MVRREWVTQLGTATSVAGGDNTGVDSILDHEIDNNGNIHIAGYTTGSLVEANAGGRDIFVLKFSNTGSLLDGIQFGSNDKGSRRR